MNIFSAITYHKKLESLKIDFCRLLIGFTEMQILWGSMIYDFLREKFFMREENWRRRMNKDSKTTGNDSIKNVFQVISYKISCIEVGYADMFKSTYRHRGGGGNGGAFLNTTLATRMIRAAVSSVCLEGFIFFI